MKNREYNKKSREANIIGISNMKKPIGNPIGFILDVLF